MKTSYEREQIGNLTITTARTIASFYGICGEVAVKTFALPSILGIRLDFRPAIDQSSRVFGCSFTNVIRIADGSGTRRRYVDQTVSIPACVVEVYPLSDVRLANEGIAREICQSLFRNYEGVLHLARKSVIDSFSKNFREQAIEYTDRTYGKSTEETARKVLASLNWPLLLEKATPPDVFCNVIDTTMTRNFPSYYKLGSEGYRDPIDVTEDKYSRLQARLEDIHRSYLEEAMDAERRVALAEEYRRKRIEMEGADRKARDLLRLVCGEEKEREYVNYGYITVERNGWKFCIQPRTWTMCENPGGHRARLCIHTYSLSVNPIDEVTLQYLWIKNKFEDYLKTAVPHDREPGFSLKEFGNPYG